MAIVMYVNADADVSAGTGARLGFFALAFADLDGVARSSSVRPIQHA